MQFFNLQGKKSSKLSLVLSLYIELSFQSSFSKGEWRWCLNFRNLQAIGYQVPPSVETQNVFHNYGQHRAESVLLQTCFSLLIHTMWESICFQVRLQSITIYNQSQPLTWSHQRCTLKTFSFWNLSFEACISEIIFISNHLFAW